MDDYESERRITGAGSSAGVPYELSKRYMQRTKRMFAAPYTYVAARKSFLVCPPLCRCARTNPLLVIRVGLPMV